MPKGWAWCRLGEIANIARGGSPRPIQDYITNAENGINWIKIGDTAENSKYISSAKEKIKPEGIKHSRFVHSGDFLLTNSMSFGRPYILKIDGCIHDGWLVFANIKECLNQDYLYYILSSKYIYETFSHIAVGSTVKNLKSDTVKQVLFPLPSISEQNRIVESVDKIFTIIKSIEQNKSILQDSIKQAKSKILDLAIHGKLVPQDPNDEPAEELLKRIATSDNRPYEKVDSSEIDWKLPKNWTLCHFGDIATIINGKTQSKVENPDGKYPIYGSGGIMGRADDYICPENCTIIGRKGSINNPIFVEEKFWNVDTAFGLCPSEAVLPKFLFYFCEYFDFTTLDSSTTLPSLTKTNIQQIIFALPPIEEQERILDKTDELFDSLDEIVLNLV
ncbi:MAG: restriction endonuclease subunit S [Treponema sp.]